MRTKIRLWWYHRGHYMALDRLKESLAAVVRAMIPGVDYFGWYRARVIQQKVLTSGAMTVDVQPDDPRIPGMAGIKLKLGLPATTVTIPPGAYVLVGWEGGDPQRPQAALWDGGETPTTKTVINSLNLILGGELGAEAAIKGQTYRSGETTLNNSLANGFTALAAVSVGTLSPLAAGFSALAAALQTFEGGSPTYLATRAKVS
jgi:hypothetical protein